MEVTEEPYVIDLPVSIWSRNIQRLFRHAIDKNIYLDDGDIYYYGFDLEEEI